MAAHQQLVGERTFEETLESIKFQRVHASEKFVKLLNEELNKYSCRNNNGASTDVISIERSVDAHFEYKPSVKRSSPSRQKVQTSVSQESKSIQLSSGTGAESQGRTFFKDKQLQVLCETFDKNRCPDVQIREELATITSIPEKKLKTWFRNRRAKILRARNTSLTETQSFRATHVPSKITITTHYGPIFNFPIPPPSSLLRHSTPTLSNSPALCYSSIPSLPQTHQYFVPSHPPHFVHPYNFVTY